MVKSRGQLPPEERPGAGERINIAKQQVEQAIETRKTSLVEESLNAQLSSEAIDVKLPGRRKSQGGLHPITITIDSITTIFETSGYEVAEGPGTRDDYNKSEP